MLDRIPAARHATQDVVGLHLVSHLKMGRVHCSSIAYPISSRVVSTFTCCLKVTLYRRYILDAISALETRTTTGRRIARVHRYTKVPGGTVAIGVTFPTLTVSTWEAATRRMLTVWSGWPGLDFTTLWDSPKWSSGLINLLKKWRRISAFSWHAT